MHYHCSSCEEGNKICVLFPSSWLLKAGSATVFCCVPAYDQSSTCSHAPCVYKQHVCACPLGYRVYISRLSYNMTESVPQGVATRTVRVHQMCVTMWIWIRIKPMPMRKNGNACGYTEWKGNRIRMEMRTTRMEEQLTEWK